MKKRGAFDIEWKNQKTEPPLQDTYSARHLPNGKLTRYGMRKKLQEMAQKNGEEHDLPVRGESGNAEATPE